VPVRPIPSLSLAKMTWYLYGFYHIGGATVAGAEVKAEDSRSVIHEIFDKS